MAFNFQARVQLTGPYNVQQVAQQISRQLSNVQAKVNLQVSSAGLQQIGQINSALYGFSGASKRAGADLKALNNDMYNFGEQAGLATRRFLAFTLAAGAITGIVIGFKNGISSAVQFQRELVRFDQISGDTRATIKGVADEVTRLATTFGVSSKELIQSATILRQAGLSALETKTALEALSLAALSPNFGKFSENVEGAIAVMRQFNVGSEQLTQAFGSINAVAGDYAVEAKDIIDATIRAGGAFATLGGNLNEFLAIFTTVRATTRESADTIATGLRTIFARLQQSDTVDALKDLQINLRHTGEEAARLGNVNLTNQFVGPYEAIRRLSEGLKDLPSTDPRFAAVVEQIGGIRQISRVLPLLQQDKLRESVLRTASLGTGSLLPGAEKAQESLLNRVDKTREGFEKLFRTIADDKGFQNLIKVGLSAADMFAKIAEYAVPLIPVLAAFGVSRAPGAISQFGQGAYDKFRNDKSKPYYNVRGFATGDVVPGSGNTDSVAANLMPGEFVFRKQAVQDIGIDNLRSLHQKAHIGAGVRHFAAGGSVNSGRIKLNSGSNEEVDFSDEDFYFDKKQLGINRQNVKRTYSNLLFGKRADNKSSLSLKNVFKTPGFIGTTGLIGSGLGFLSSVSQNAYPETVLGASVLGGITTALPGLIKLAQSGESSIFSIIGSLFNKGKQGVKGLYNKGKAGFGEVLKDDNSSSANPLSPILTLLNKPEEAKQTLAKYKEQQALKAFDNAQKIFNFIGVKEPFDEVFSDKDTKELKRISISDNPKIRGLIPKLISSLNVASREYPVQSKIEELSTIKAESQDYFKKYKDNQILLKRKLAGRSNQEEEKPLFGTELGQNPLLNFTIPPDDILSVRNPSKPDFLGKRGARAIHTKAAYDVMSRGGSLDDAVAFLQSNNFLSERTSRKYAKDAQSRVKDLKPYNSGPFSQYTKFAEGGLLGGNIGAALKKLTAVNKNNFAAVLAGLGVRFGGTNDDYVMEALLKAKRKEGEAVVSSYSPKKYAEGGLHTEVPDLVKAMAGRTGIRLDNFFSKITFNDDNFGYGEKAYGTYSNVDRAINLNLNKIGDSDKLKRVLSHEIGHSLDYGRNSVAHSNRASNEELQEALLSLSPRTHNPAYKKQSRLLRESFAETFRTMMGYGELQDSKHIQFARPEQVPAVAQQIDKILGRYREDFPYKKFATGGNVGATDVVPAALTPGEFIFSREATSRIGVANLHRANKSGDISHMAGLTGFHKGGHVGRLNLATGSSQAVQSSVLDEVARSGSLRTFNVNKQQQFIDALALQYQKSAKAEGLNLTATEALARAKIELSRILVESKDQTAIDTRIKQVNKYAAIINDPSFDPNSKAGQGTIKSFEHLNRELEPILKRGAFNSIDGTIVGVGGGKNVDESLLPSPRRVGVKELRSLPLSQQYFNTDTKGGTDTTLAQLITKTNGSNFTVNSVQRSLEKVLTKKYEEEAKARGLYITQVQLETKARAESTRLINLAQSKEYAEATKDFAKTSSQITSPGFKGLSVKEQNEIIQKNAGAAKIKDAIDEQIGLVTKGGNRNIVQVGDYKLAPRPTLQRDLTGPASSIKPVSELFTSPRDNGFIQKLTGNSSYNTSLTNLLAAGQTKDTLRPQLESAIQAQLKREYEESGKAISASELITRSKIGANKLLEVASSKEVQVVNRRVQFYEKLIQSPAFSGRTEESRNKIESAYNVYKTRQNELQELTSVRTQRGQIIGRGGVTDDQSALARRENFNNRILLGAQIGLPILGSFVDSANGEAENNLNSTGRYRTGRTAGGALQGAAVGATAGSVLGAPGAIVGGILGTLVGGVNAFVEAGNELRKAKLGEVLTNLAINISSGAREIERSGSLGSNLRESSQSDLRQSLSLLKPENTTPQAIGQALGAQRGIGQALNTLLEDDIRRIIKQNPNLSARDIQGQLESDSNRENINFQGGNIQANQYQLLSLATTRDAGSSTFRANFTQFIESLQRSLAAESITRETSRIANAFGLLAGYIDRASSSFDKIESSIETSLNILSGRGGPERLRLQSDVSSVNPFSQTFGQNFNQQLSPFGTVGTQIGARANEFQSLAQQLPEILNDIFASGNVSGGGFRESLDRRAGNGFSATTIGSQAIQAFNDLTKDGKISQPDLQAGIVGKLKTQFESIVPALEKIIQSTNSYAAVLNEAAKAQNEVIKLTLQANQAGLEVERINAQIQAVRAGRSDGGSFLNRGAIDRPFNANIEQLLRGSPFAGQNPNNLNIGQIGQAFQRTISDASDIRAGRPQATDLATTVARTLGQSANGLLPGLAGTAQGLNGSGVNPAVASQSLNNLAKQGDKYRQVLEAYTNVTARAVRVNEDLNNIRGDRQGRQNLASRFLSGGAQEQSEIFRGLGLVQNLRNTPGGLQGLGQESRALAISTLQGLGQTRLNIGGQRIAADQVLQQEQERAFPGLFVQTNKDEEDALIQLRKINEDAKAAYTALGDANKVFSDKANAWAVDIFNRNSETLGEAANKLNQIAAGGPNQNNSSSPGPSLTGPGSIFNDIAGRTGLNISGPFSGNNVTPPQIEDTGYWARFRQFWGGAFSSLGANGGTGAYGFAQGGSVFKPKGTDTVPAMLSPGEFIVNAASTKANYSLLNQINSTKQPIYKANGGMLPQGWEDLINRTAVRPEPRDRLPEGYADLIRRTARPPEPRGFSNPTAYNDLIARTVGNRVLTTEEQDTRNRNASRIRMPSGSYDSPATFFNNSLNNDGVGSFQRGNIRNVQGAQIASFLAESGNPFDRLVYGNQARSYQQRITEAGNNFRNLQRPNAQQLNNFRAANYRPARGFANGGFVGSDTIPAMLSPGEFIVNSSATANNLPLLRSINDTRSPVYRAAGGLIGPAVANSEGGTGFNSGLTQALTSFGDSSKSLVTALQSFSSVANELAASIARFPTKMEVSVTHNVNVNHNGTQAFATMQKEVATLVIGETQARLQDTFKTAFPDVNISFTGASIK